MSGERDSQGYVVRGPGAFGAAVKEFRHRRGFTQQQLADRAGMHRSYLAKLESGTSTEALTQLLRACAALGVEVVVRERLP